MNRKDLKIVVVCGGISSEREVSLRSGQAVWKALQKNGYSHTSLFDLNSNNLVDLLKTPMDLAFLALHGKGGEDGCIQGALELAGIPYTGSSVEASAICMNKIKTKEILEQAGIPTPRFATVYAKDVTDLEVTAKNLIQKIGLPMVLKSPREGSSIGVFIVKHEQEIVPAMKEIFSFGDLLLAEAFISGVEVTLPILGNNEPRALPVVEITSENEFYDYEAKYTKGMCHHVIPARIPDFTQSEIAEVGKKAYRLLGCQGLSRIDFIVNAHGKPMLIEVNTLPGMTEMSLFPDSARYAGISFEELIDKIVQLALEK